MHRKRPLVTAERLEDRRLLTAFFGLTTSNAIVRFDSSAPSQLLAPLAIRGLQVGESIQSIDVRLKTGDILAVSSAARLYAIDPATGRATLFERLGSAAILHADGPYSLAYNSVLDKVRVSSVQGENTWVKFGLGPLLPDRADNSAGLEPAFPLVPSDQHVVSGQVTPVRISDLAFGTRALAGNGSNGQGPLFALDIVRQTLLVQPLATNASSYEFGSSLTTVATLSRHLEAASLEVVTGPWEGFGNIPPENAFVLGRERSGDQALYSLSLTDGTVTSLGNVADASAPDGLELADFAVDFGNILSAPVTVVSLSSADGKVHVPIRRSSVVGELSISTSMPVTDGTGAVDLPSTITFADGQAVFDLAFTPRVIDSRHGAGFQIVLGTLRDGFFLGTPINFSYSTFVPPPPPEQPELRVITSPHIIFEPDPGLSAIEYLPFGLSTTSSERVSFLLTFLNTGTASSGTDYTAPSPTRITFEPGEIRRLVPIEIIGDALVESDETFNLAVSELVGITLASDEQQHFVIENVNPAGTPTISTSDSYRTMVDPPAGQSQVVSFRLKMDVPSPTPITLQIGLTSDSSATEGLDFRLLQTFVTFAPGQTTHDISVEIIGDNLAESQESLTLRMQSSQAVIDYFTSPTVVLNYDAGDTQVPGAPAGSGTISVAGLPATLTAAKKSGKVIALLFDSSGTAEKGKSMSVMAVFTAADGRTITRSARSRGGRAVFSGFPVPIAGTGNLLVTADGHSGDVRSITIAPAEPRKLAVRSPLVVSSGAAFGASVQLLDRFGNRTTTDGGEVAVLFKGPRNATIAGVTHATFLSGKATFSDLAIGIPGRYRITATSTKAKARPELLIVT